MPRPTDHAAVRRTKEKARFMKRQANLAQRQDPRRRVHENAFPDAPEAFEGIARTLSSGLR